MSQSAALVKPADFRYRPLPIRIYNRLSKLSGERPIEIEKLIAASRRHSKLEDFGDESFRGPLSKLLSSINSEARLNAFGRFITNKRLTSLLSNRLRAEHYFKVHPEIAKQKLIPPIFITGLQRTGTTFLQRLLSADPDSRPLYSWEALNPAPYLNTKHRKQDPRIKEALTAEKGLRYLSPGFFSIHPVEHNAPEEDILLLDISFLSTVPEATLNVPTYATWLEQQDTTAAYHYMKKLLKLLQWQRTGNHWILKSPHHMEFMDDLFAVFPNAKIIQTHRDPYKTIPSFCSMIAYSRNIFSDHVDTKQVAKHWTRKTARMVQQAMNYRDQVGGDNFLDISYYDLIKDPLAVVKKIYEFTHIPLTDSALAAMKKLLAQNRRHKYGVHQYNMSDFGLNKKILDQHFGQYRERHDIIIEN